MAVDAASLKADVESVLKTVNTVLVDIAPFEKYFPAPVKTVLTDVQEVLSAVEAFLS